MMSFAIDYKEALKELTSDMSNGLRRFELEESEWKLAADITEYLKDGTLFFSRDSPNLQKVIPAMDKIDHYFTTYLKNESLNVAIRAAIISAKSTLNKYYELTDHAEVYRIAMVLDPHYKLRYFQKAGWDDEWIQTSRQLVQEELKRSYWYFLPLPCGDSDSDCEYSDTNVEGSEVTQMTAVS
ncbi:hypothetical protein BGW80DRAFT_1173113 [Lactifluus volemus]|nr:hypothetical protein BGW80DRAFT_1173113 [Lactifluus volemus]